MTVLVVSAGELPVVFAALEARWGVPPAPRGASMRAGLEEGRPVPTAVGTGRTQSFDVTKPSEEEVSCA